MTVASDVVAPPSSVDGSARAAARPTLGLAVVCGTLHAIVDLCTVTTVTRTACTTGSALLTPFHLVLGYDLIAFALQLPLGLLVDRLRTTRWALLGGLGCVAAALPCIPLSGVATMATAGLGNALFHVGAGAIVLVAAAGRAAPVGVFVAPGALGLGLGMWLGRQVDWPIWPLGLCLTLAIPVACGVRAGGAVAVDGTTRAARGWWSLALAALLASVVIRSFVGVGGPYEVPQAVALMVALPLVGFGGKLLGGLLADRLGWLETSVGALLASAPLIAFGRGSFPVVLCGLLLFQTTMPVTLTAVYRLLPDKPATAFGLSCLALIAGAVPTFYPAGQRLYGAHTFLTLIVVSALAVALGLLLLGVRGGVGAPGRRSLIAHATLTARRRGGG